MKSAGVPTRKAREPRAFGASLAAMLLALFASALAAAQSGPDTAASETWKTAAASAAPAAPVAAASAAPAAPVAAASAAPAAPVAAASGAGAPIAEAAPPSPPRTAIAPSAGSATAAGPSNMVATPLDIDATQPGTAEIPAANSAAASPPQQASSPALDSQPSADSQSPNDSGEVARYQQEQSGMPPEQLRALQQFDSEGELSAPFGMQLREAKRSLKSGEEADGLLITGVQKGSPAAAAGLRPYSHAVHDAIAAAAIVGALFSGGLSVVVIPALDYMQVGESYDMIIGVDGSRVTNFLDFQDRMRDLQPGELVYLSVVRDGRRLQLTLPVTANTLQATN